MKNYVILSNKFSPAHFSHLVAYYNLIVESGNICKLVLHPDYKEFINNHKNNLKVIYLDNYDKIKISCDILLIYNISKNDKKCVNVLKKINNNMKLFTIVHEPWCGYAQSIKDLFSRNEPFKEIIKRIGRKIYLNKLLKMNSKIIVCSKNAKKIFESKYKKYNAFLVPLLFSDELNNNELSNKIYFSFIGSASVAHGFDLFIKFMKDNKNSDIDFLIATSTDISLYLQDDDIKELISSGKLVVRHGKYLTNEEINECYLNSKVLWLYYKRTTQSGVLCKSFMFGTPVICSNKGSFKEFINDGNGRIAENYDSIVKYFNILSSIDNYDNCRKSYLDFFDYQNKINYVINILK